MDFCWWHLLVLVLPTIEENVMISCLSAYFSLNTKSINNGGIHLLMPKKDVVNRIPRLTTHECLSHFKLIVFFSLTCI